MTSHSVEVEIQVDKYDTDGSTVALPDSVAAELGVTGTETLRVEGRTSTVVRKTPGTTPGDAAVLSSIASMNAGVSDGDSVTLDSVDPPLGESVTLTPFNEDARVVGEALSEDPSPVVERIVSNGDYITVDVEGAEETVYFGVYTANPEPCIQFGSDTNIELVRPEPDDRPRSILTPEERVQLTHPSLCVESFDAITERLEQALCDLQILARQLPDEALCRVFGRVGEDGYETRSAVQDALSLLYLGLQGNGDDVEARFAEAIRRAEYTHDIDAHVTVDVVREDVLPTDVALQRLQEHGLTDPTAFAEYERVKRNSSVRPGEVIQALEETDETPLTAFGIEMERASATYGERVFPFASIMDVTTAEYDP
ncbi:MULTISPECIES: hypothetical protein [unclassified Haloferax]|uniref:hypothetical protein n=1 Tax=unclassified Haloferax TaxID=2625095 RepID=UPI00287584E7|nr:MULTISPECIES: hypothetical protein [unclassified Haloferax]MDS0243648.1 hypothetical protein [Haloferax sp. S2CR25]MDS0446769.1 hypothetical protein [Haloferax sp. S2CR25-2]